MATEGKVLSQSEIDALLSAFSDDDAEEGGDAPLAAATQVQVAARPVPQNVRIYDFRRPSKVSKEQLRTLTSIHESVARLLTTAMTSQLRTGVQVTLSSVEQSNYEDYIRELGENAMVSVVSLDPLPGAIIWEIAEESSFALVDRLLGGIGTTILETRELSEIEIALIKGVVRNGLAAYRDAWSNIADIDPALEETYVGPQYVQIALATDTVMVAVFEIRMNEETGTMTMCIPYSVIEPIIGNLSTRALFASNRHEERGTNMGAIINSLQDVRVPLSAVLGRVNLDFSDIVGLRTGNVIVLDSKRDDPIPVFVSGEQKFTARPRTTGKHFAIKIEEATKDYEVPEDLIDAIMGDETATVIGNDD
jgi:flagellar motor switch protein FliM